MKCDVLREGDQAPLPLVITGIGGVARLPGQRDHGGEGMAHVACPVRVRTEADGNPALVRAAQQAK